MRRLSRMIVQYNNSHNALDNNAFAVKGSNDSWSLF